MDGGGGVGGGGYGCGGGGVAVAPPSVKYPRRLISRGQGARIAQNGQDGQLPEIPRAQPHAVRAPVPGECLTV